MPRCALEWYESSGKTDLASLIRQVADDGNRAVLVRGDRSYHPSVLRKAIEWKGETGVLAFTTESELIGIYAMSHTAIHTFALDNRDRLETLRRTGTPG